ncbi:Uncharacterised protein r2_g1597 [Pycnogonum litorale]
MERRKTRQNKIQLKDICSVMEDLPSDSEVEDISSDDCFDPDWENETFASESESGDETTPSTSQHSPVVSTSQSTASVPSTSKILPSAQTIIPQRSSIWYVKDNDFAQNPPIYIGNLKVKVLANSPIEMFTSLFPETLIKDICYQTNLYAMQQGKEGFNLTPPELKIFLGINIVMTYIKYARIRQYWSSQRSIRLPLIADHMSVNRFENIRRFLHF